MAKRNPLVVGLDVGTYKIGVVVAEVASDGGLEVTGIGTASSVGCLQKGVVTKIDETVKAIRKAVEEAELMAGCEIRTVVVGSAGSHIKGVNSHGVVAVQKREVSPGDVERVLDAARAIALPMDREVLHVLAQEFVVDDQGGIEDPLGMTGVRLEARVHIVAGAIRAGQDLIKCCNKAGLKVEDVVAGPLAAMDAVLAAEERELGVALVDVGAGTTSVVVAYGGAIVHTAVLPVGGANVTSDLSAALQTPKTEAERLKQRHGCAVLDLAPPDASIEVPGLGGQPGQQLTPRELASYVEPRCDETLQMARDEIERAGLLGRLACGVVLTGGGSVLHGMDVLAKRVFKRPVRAGVPQQLSGLVDVVASPMYSTAVGLVLHGHRRHGSGARIEEGMLGSVGKLGRRLMGWAREIF